MDVIGRKDRAAVCSSNPVEPLDPGGVISAIKPARRDMAERRQCFAQPLELGFENIEIVGWPGNEGDVFCICRDVGQAELAFAFLGTHLAQAQQPRQPAVAITIDGISKQARRPSTLLRTGPSTSLRTGFGEIEPAADQRLQPRLFARAVHSHHASEGVAVGDSDRIHAKFERAEHKLDRVRCSAEKRKRRSDAEFDISRAFDRRRRHVLAPH